MAMKKAVVASKLPALEEIIDDGTTGLLYHADDVDSLVEIIERVLSDNDLINSLGTNAHKWIIENRTWQSVVQNYSKAYQTAKENKR